MKHEVKNGILTVFLEGRIDAGNADAVESELNDILSKEAGMKPVFDAGDLEYISSAGLRLLYKLEKGSGEKLSIINTSGDVYEILETTGFTELFRVRRKLREISVDGCTLIGSGAYGNVYRIDGETIAKIYREGVPLEFVEGEKEAAKRAFVLGMPTAISFDVVKCGNCYGTVYEILDAKTVSQLLNEDPSSLAHLSEMMGKSLKDIHKIVVPESSSFESRKEIMKSWLSTMESYLTGDEYKKIAGFLDSIPEKRTFLHGDFNTNNVMIKDDEINLIDVGDAAYGHPVFDMAMGVFFFKVLAGTQLVPGLNEELRKRLVGFDLSLAPKIWEIICKTYFDVKTDKEVEEITKKIMPLSQIYFAYQGSSTGRTSPEDMTAALIRPVLMPMLEETPTLEIDM
ncbi:MAG: phosphotransferase [Lachnospiraceae bacterium]|nr:phosphotransferase [Lachnospiraceae bacterium]